MNFLTATYAIYALVAVGLTATLARTLYRNGALFLTDVFEDRPELAPATNNLLVTGFYMLNLGYALLIFRAGSPTDIVGATELLVTRLGLLLVSLGVIHFINMGVFWKIQRSHRPTFVPPPPVVPPPPIGSTFTGAVTGGVS